MAEGEMAYSYVMSAILDGRLQAGEKLSEPHLAADLGLSRAPVREALRRLQTRGLLTYVPNHGMRVIKPDYNDYLALFAVRETLEVMACGLAAIVMTQDELDRLGALVRAHDTEVAQEPSEAYLQRDKDMDFHLRIAQGAHNSVLQELLCEQLYPRLKLCRLEHQTVWGRGRTAWLEHAKIYEALAARDSELAQLMMRRHLQASKAATETLKL